MAQALSTFEDKSDPFAGVTQAAYLEFLNRYADADEEISQAVAARKDLRAEIKSTGIPLKAFDRARRDAGVSGDVRETEELWYRKMMSWLAKPVGFSPSFDFSAPEVGLAALNVHELHKVDHEGLDAGRNGRHREANPYTPGTEAHQRFDTAWLRGQGEIASSMAPEQKRSRGRPRKDGTPAQSRGGLTVHDGGAGTDPDSDTRH